jgi:hypothetical protein
MTNFQQLQNMSSSELEKFLAPVLERLLVKWQILPPVVNGEQKQGDLMATFGAWDDPRSADEIVDEIYLQRTIGNE